jgi:hypothetical protein
MVSLSGPSLSTLITGFSSITVPIVNAQNNKSSKHLQSGTDKSDAEKKTYILIFE